MANIDNIRIGELEPLAIMFGKNYIPKANQFFSFGQVVAKDNTWDDMPVDEWEINDGWEVEFANGGKKLKINKFKIDTWGLRQKHPKNSAMLGNFRDKLKINVTGLANVHQNIIKADAGSDGVTGFVQAKFPAGGWITNWYPGQYEDTDTAYYLQGLVIQGCGCYTNSWDQYGDTSYTMGRAPWEANSGRDHWVEDGIRPTGCMTGESNGVCIGLFGGCQTAAALDDNSNGAYKIYDISDSPVCIDLDVDDTEQRIDLSSVECWDAYAGSTHVYHKDKTFGNCWEKYGYVKAVPMSDGEGAGTVNMVCDANNANHAPGFVVPEITDFEQAYNANRMTFNINADDGFWSRLKEFLKTHDFWDVDTDFEDRRGFLQYSNIAGEIELHYGNREGHATTLSGMHLFEDTGLTKITFSFDDTEELATFTSANTLFYKAGKLTEIVSNRAFHGGDCSGMFEFCGALATYPKDLIDWSRRGGKTYGGVPFACNRVDYFAEYSGLVTIPYVGEQRDDAAQYIICSDAFSQFANGASKLQSIGPVMDFRYTRAALCNQLFTGCDALADVRFKNLNHGDWRLDGSSYGDGKVTGNLKGLDADSVEYLFANLYDLTTRDESLAYNGLGADGDGNGNEVVGNPDASSAALYCPAEWSDKITGEMVSAANAKGWSVYVGGVLENQ